MNKNKTSGSSFHDYRMLVPALLVFYVIMTLDYHDIQQGNTIAWVKLGLGVFSIIYLISVNVSHFLFKEKGD